MSLPPNFAELMQDPEIMQLMQNPDMMQKLQAIMANPQEAMQYMNDPDVQRLLQKFGSGGAGMGGFGAGQPAASGASAAPAAPSHSPNFYTISSPSQLQYKLNDAKKNNKPCVLDFTATWCGPCQRIAPEFVRLAETYPNIQFFKIDEKQNRDAIDSYGITGFPTFMFFDVQGKQFDTFSGANLPQLENNLREMNNQVAKLQTQRLYSTYSHFPLKENEVVLFKAIAWDKISAKLTSLLADENAPASLYAPFEAGSAAEVDNYPTATALLQDCATVITFLTNFKTTSMSDFPVNGFRALNVLLQWPVDQLATPLHIFRLAVTHIDFSKQVTSRNLLAANQSVQAPQPPTSPSTQGATPVGTVISRLCARGEEIENALVGVGLCRALCNLFDKKAWTRMLLTSMDDFIAFISYICLTLSTENAVLTSALALLLNTSYMISIYAPSTVEGLSRQAVVINFQKSLITAILETLPMAVTAPDGVYRLLVALGTLLFPYYLLVNNTKQQNTDKISAELAALDAFNGADGVDLITSWKNDYADNQNVCNAVNEILALVAYVKDAQI